MHVLILPSWYPTPAAPISGTFIHAQALALKRAGVRVGVVYPDFRSPRTLRRGGMSANRFHTTGSDEDGITTLRYQGWKLPKLPIWNGRLWIERAVALTERYVAENGRPQIVHAHATCWAGAAALALMHRLDLPYMVTEHSSAFLYGTIHGWTRGQVIGALCHASRILAVSPALADAMRPYAGKRSMEIVPNVIDTTFFGLPPALRSTEPFRFLTVGMLTRKKGMDVMIRAFAVAFRSRSDVLLEIGGDGPERGTLIALAKELKIADQVVFLGLLDRGQVRAAMWRANSYVLASPKETFGVALLEAMATGLPVIATRSGGPDSLVTPQAGRLVPPAEPEALAEAMRALRSEGGHDRARELAIHNYVEEGFGPHALVARLKRCYTETIEATAVQPVARDEHAEAGTLA